MSDEYLTTTQVADRLGVSAESVRRWIRAGTLVAVKIGGIQRIPASAIDEHLTQQDPEAA